MIEKIINLGDKINHYIIPEYLIGKQIIDAGANIGNCIKKLRELGINSLIVAIEPCVTNVEELHKNEFVNVTIRPNALVSRSSPTVTMFTEIEGLSEWGSITDINTHKERAAANVKKRYPVNTITLDEICKNIEVVDYLKMDIEGSETEIVMEMTLELAKKIRQLSIEVHNGDKVALEEKLKSLGYLTHYIGEDIYGIRSEICQ